MREKGRSRTTGRALLISLLAVSLALTGSSRAEEMRTSAYQPTPFTVWLDFASLMRPDAKPPSFPVWLESVQVTSALRPEGEVTNTTYRIRFRRFATLNRTLMFRVYFTDLAGKGPMLTAWSETGDRVVESPKMGAGLGLPTSETVTIPMEEVDYVELDVPGDGTSLRGALLTSLEESDDLQSIDFALPSQTIDPFRNDMKGRDMLLDEEVFGRLAANLAPEPVRLSKDDGSTAASEFDLESKPLMAMVTFEILNADVESPPQIILNQRPLGPAKLILPDLADPAYTGTVKALSDGMEIRYAGWIRAQCAIPAAAFANGANTLYIQSPAQTGAIAVRAVALQLKYDSSTFDYKLVPLIPLRP